MLQRSLPFDPADKTIRRRLVKPIVAYLPEKEDRWALTKGVGDESLVSFCVTPIDLLARANTDLDGLVVDINAIGTVALAELAVRSSARNHSALLVGGLDNAAATRLVSFARVAPDCLFALRGHHDLGRRLAHLSRTKQGGFNDIHILSQLAPVVPPAILDVVATAILATDAKTSVSDLARFLGTSVRTLESRMASHAGLSAKRLLMWVVTLRAAYEVGTARRTTKMAAVSTNVQSQRALSNRVERVTGKRLAHLRSSSVLADLLVDFSQRIQRNGSEQMLLRSTDNAPDSGVRGFRDGVAS